MSDLWIAFLFYKIRLRFVIMCRTGERAFIINNTQTYENQNRQEERTSALCIDEIRDFLDPKNETEKW